MDGHDLLDALGSSLQLLGREGEHQGGDLVGDVEWSREGGRAEESSLVGPQGQGRHRGGGRGWRDCLGQGETGLKQGQPVWGAEG